MRVRLAAGVVALSCGALLLGVLSGARAGTPRDILQHVGLDQHLGAQIPLSLALRDEQGAPASLAALVARRPAVLALVYYQCPNLCTLTLNALGRSLRKIDLRAGSDFEVVAVSIDPRDSPGAAAAERAAYLARYGRTADLRCRDCDSGWHFLTGAASQSAALARSVGFRYLWDPLLQQYAHPAAIVVLTPGGRVSQYFNGVDYPPWELRRALERAAAGATGTLAERFWLLCYRYEALAGRYAALVLDAVRAVALLTVLALAALIFRLTRSTP
jgi:protein SCO1/2